MEETTIPFNTFLAASTFHSPVPGPDRRRTTKPYEYRVTFLARNPGEVGCAMTCEVVGGRSSYQVALERQAGGRLRWHCTCADAVYRGEQTGRLCKHVRGVLALGRPKQAG